MAFIAPPDWRPRGIDNLEPKAWEALQHKGSTCLIAGPGAGKTELLAQRAAFLLQTGMCPPPYRILAISFKTDAAHNLAKRVRIRCPADQARRFDSYTFDAFTKGLVDRFLDSIPPPWRPSRPYDIVFPKNLEIEDFLTRSRVSIPTDAPAEWQDEIANFIASKFENHYVGRYRLPIEELHPTSGSEFVIREWWTERLRKGSQSALTFVSLNRLAELVLRANIQVLRALQSTYPFIFVDEFQDTTYAQYDFLHAAFSGGRTAITVVGDSKQRIMTWAGARADAFTRFEADFTAHRIPLFFNFRSSPDLVHIQNVVARALNADSIEIKPQTQRIVDGDVAQVWTFNTEQCEAKQIADWICLDMHRRGTKPREYAILVRQHAQQFGSQLTESFAAAGIKIRNESQTVGLIPLQDLLTEEITDIAVALLRLGAQSRAPEAWRRASNAIAQIRFVNPEDEIAYRRTERDLTDFLTRLRLTMIVPPSSEGAEDIAKQIFEFLDLAAVAQAFTEYANSDMLSRLVEAFRLHLVGCVADAPTWSECFDVFEGIAQVPLMTVHKSKGLEYDTIFCVGLDDKIWWSYRTGNPEEIAAFFVALSRAKQRAIFTFCQGRGQRKRVVELYQLLSNAGVPEISF